MEKVEHVLLTLYLIGLAYTAVVKKNNDLIKYY